ncbi:FecCD family ABC transporter permease [Glycomyces paridis]|uniref:Fe(3+)-siderophore ABC transporter permease n=1 Tax=Glycomyces paridis TaxID=2126555 RepID=A0A4V4HPA0_9ACTN|nr:iron chelate uptake ABC transporter family permease subunit [Glycomyces paridis]THV29076.1 Fe(3+)-siderophore ABC transporter permease [Glycomyces paridis]
MSAPTLTAEAGAAPVDRRRRRLLGLAAAAAALAVLVLLSLALGSKPLPLADVAEALWRDNGDPHVIVVGQRLPRTALALAVGLALAVAGALMQGLTRNPLADPGLLGVSAGAALGMVLVVRAAPAASDLLQVWAAFAGAVVTACAVFLIGSLGGRGRSPVTLVLAGVALGAVLQGIASTVVLLNADAFLTMRSWQAGSVADLGWGALAVIAPFLAAGLLLAAVAARGLNAVALGEDLANALGANQWLTRIAVVAAVTLLCGSATAAVGVIWFLGMMVPHVARWITGPDQRWILAYSCLLGPALMVAADVLGRVVVIPDEIPAGVVTAVIGAPVLIWMVRRSKASGL